MLISHVLRAREFCNDLQSVTNSFEEGSGIVLDVRGEFIVNCKLLSKKIEGLGVDSLFIEQTYSLSHPPFESSVVFRDSLPVSP